MKIAYLYSRFPVVSQTFCVTEMLALERLGVSISVASLFPPTDNIRHGALGDLQAEVAYAPPQSILKIWEGIAKADKKWPAELVKRHESIYGPEYKAALRARNALFFADTFVRWGIDHFHVHFANRATHTAIFLKKLSGIPFSFTAHAQDFQVQLGSNHVLLREMCEEAKFVVAVSDYSRGELARICPEAAGKIVHVYNGIDFARFGSAAASPANAVPKILSVGRLIGIKGFQPLIAACALLKERGIPFECEIVGEGPLQAALQEEIGKRGLGDRVCLAGALPQEEVARRLLGCDVFTLASVEEPDGACDVLPTVILEAMAAGRPVVSTRLAAIPEMVEDGVSGLLVSPGSGSELAEALATLLSDPALRREYGLAGRRKAETAFRVEDTSSRLKSLFDQHVHASKEAAPLQAQGSSAILLHQWPSESFRTKTREPLTTIYACKAGPVPSGLDAAARLLTKEIEFLPDAAVLEAEWKQDTEWAARIEACRQELGPDLDPAVFHEQACHALWLRKAVERRHLRHVHAIGSEALLCAWILRKLSGVAFDGTLEKTPRLPGGCVQILAAGCSGEGANAKAPKVPVLRKLASALAGRGRRTPALPKIERP